VADGLNLRVLRWDSAARSELTPFLLVHGLASNARLWDGMGPRLAAAGHAVAAVDLRGHGLSDKPDGGYDFATISEDLRALIAALGFDRPVLAGQSWGAGVVLDFAVRHPERSRRRRCSRGISNRLTTPKVPRLRPDASRPRDASGRGRPLAMIASLLQAQGKRI